MKGKAVGGGAVVGWVGLLWGGWGCCGVGGAGRSGALQTSGEPTLKFLQKAIYLNKSLPFRTSSPDHHRKHSKEIQLFYSNNALLLRAIKMCKMLQTDHTQQGYKHMYVVYMLEIMP